FSPNGAWVVTDDDDGTARIWNANTGAEIRRFEGHACESPFDSDGSRVATADETAVRIWNVNTGAEIRRLEGHQGSLFSCSFSPDGRRVIAGSNAGTANVWDADTGTEIAVLKGHEGSVFVTFSLDGTRVLTHARSADRVARVWDATTWSAVVLKGHKQ